MSNQNRWFQISFHYVTFSGEKVGAFFQKVKNWTFLVKKSKKQVAPPGRAFKFWKSFKNVKMKKPVFSKVDFRVLKKVEKTVKLCPWHPNLLFFVPEKSENVKNPIFLKKALLEKIVERQYDVLFCLYDQTSSKTQGRSRRAKIRICRFSLLKNFDKKWPKIDCRNSVFVSQLAFEIRYT